MSIHIQNFAGRHLHMIGIGGSSMSGLAGLLRGAGYVVTGSDNYLSHHVEAVRALGIPVTIGHLAENVHGAELVLYSAAISPENPERQEAKRLLIPEMERATLLGQLMEGYGQAVGVSGTHGKTTATAMIAQALLSSERDPSVHIGGDFAPIGGGTRVGAREIFVAEACEFHESFLKMRPTIAMILNIDADHLDYYRDIDHIEEAFQKFAALVPQTGAVVGNGDDERVRRVLRGVKSRAITYGTGADNDFRAENVRYDALGCASFDAMHKEKTIAHIDLKVGGAFNMMNALGALAVLQALGVDLARAAEGLCAFRGVERRLQHTGTVDGVLLYHDYGHNPTEMRGALSVIQKQPHGRLWAVMQPHTYSRVKRLFREYIDCCDAADEVLVTDIYAARESDPGDINSQMLVDAMRKCGKENVHLTPTFDDTEKYLRAHWRRGDIVLTMGCGNINELNEQIERNGA